MDEGVAKENLRLLARVIKGLKKNRAVSFDSFSKWAVTLSDLTRDEILMLGFAHQSSLASDEATAFWQSVRGAMVNAGYSADEATAIASSLARFGLLVPSPVIGGMIYYPSPWLKEICSLAQISIE